MFSHKNKTAIKWLRNILILIEAILLELLEIYLLRILEIYLYLYLLNIVTNVNFEKGSRLKIQIFQEMKQKKLITFSFEKPRRNIFGTNKI